MYQLQPAPDSGGRHLSSEGRYIEAKGGTYKLEGGTCQPEGRTYHLSGGISKIGVVPIKWRAGAQELCSSWGGRIQALDLGQVGLRGISQVNIPVRS